MRAPTTTRQSQAGMALLSALWLTLILGAIAFTVATNVRTSADAAANNIAISQAKYFAEGGINAAVAAVLSWRGGQGAAAGEAFETVPLNQYREGRRWLVFQYTAGSAAVEVVPENAKLSANYLPAPQVGDVLALVAPGAPADATAGDALADWRAPQLSSVNSEHDAYYAQLRPPYRANHGALQDVEELIAVRGFGKATFFGSVDTPLRPAEERQPPLLEVLSADTQPMAVNINYAPYQVLAVLPGWSVQLASEVVAARRDDTLRGAPFLSLDDLVRRVPRAAGMVGISRIGLTSGELFTFTSTGVNSGTGLSQTTRALVRINMAYPEGYKVIAWWDEWPWSPPPAGVLGALADASASTLEERP